MSVASPKISVIVPVYNVERYIHRCIDSILSQTFTDFELILVDDGSKDNSGAICDEYAERDSRVIIIHQANVGVSAARNAGIDIARGEYIAFVDSDDYVKSEYLSAMLNLSEGTDLVISSVAYTNNDNTFLYPQVNDGLSIITISDPKLSKLLLDRKLNYVYAKLYRGVLIKENHIRFKKDITLGEDTMFVMDYLQFCSRIHTTGEYYYLYIQGNPGSLSKRIDKNKFNSFNQINDYIENSFSRLNILTDICLSVIDKRRIQSSEWSISDIKYYKINYPSKYLLIRTIVYNPKLRDAFTRAHDDDVKSTELKLIRGRKAATIVLNFIYSDIIAYLRKLKFNFFNKVTTK